MCVCMWIGVCIVWSSVCLCDCVVLAYGVVYIHVSEVVCSRVCIIIMEFCACAVCMCMRHVAAQKRLNAIVLRSGCVTG